MSYVGHHEPVGAHESGIAVTRNTKYLFFPRRVHRSILETRAPRAAPPA